MKITEYSLFTLIESYLLNYMAWVDFIQKHKEIKNYNFIGKTKTRQTFY